ncbi:sulfotransferase [Thalassotalea litorea]|uniref:Sulfotransferase n=1 Tax=Thalassotalea litorea TaxID=2020715 RepID=A0A5R9IR45_9GAMM|nr:sulfotransferase domain-containing protein [Thalassotalea litorea]TLU65771.1 sulfotransferase [Thalassotalea litorea]
MKDSLLHFYTKSGKVMFLNNIGLSVFRKMPKRMRIWGIYLASYLRKPKPDACKFVIFAQGRTGSTVLVDLINSHPDVFCYGEILASSVVRNVSKPVRYARGLTAFTKTDAVGFKVKVYQLQKAHQQDPGKVLQEFVNQGWKIIYLHRDNLLDHAISDLRSEKTGTYHHTSKGQKQQNLVDINYDEVEKVVKFREECRRAELAALQNLEFFNISYEDHLSDAEKQTETLNRLFSFLGLPEHQVSTRFNKVIKTDLSKVISDYAQLEQRIKNSPYQHFLTAR